MTFWQLFPRILARRPVRALDALYWRLTGKKVRANNRLRTAAADLPIAYDLWISTVEKPRDDLASRLGLQIDQISGPTFTIIIDGGPIGAGPAIQATLSSLRDQLYSSWDALILMAPPAGVIAPAGVRYHGSGELADGIVGASGDYIIILNAGTRLSPLALFRYVEALHDSPGATVLYGDEDELTSGGKRREPWFKPRWNREMFLALDYLGQATAIQSAVAVEVIRSGNSTTHIRDDLLLRATELPGASIVHVPHVLSHLPPAAESGERSQRTEAVAAIVGPAGGKVSAGPFETTKVEWPLPKELPLVSIIVPTRDRVDLLRSCVGGVLERTIYEPRELVIVDNRSSDSATLDYLEQLANHPLVRVLSYDREYNYSAINNFAAKQARGSLLCLLNNDTEVLGGDWLTEMVRYAVRPEVGAVGAKLLYPDGTIQHAGVAIGIGGAAGHSHRNLPASEPGYFRQAHVTHYVSAVTAACLVVDKSKFEEVGGLDEECLAVAFNDVDLCLRLQGHGYRNVYLPHATMLHHESKSRGSDAAAENIARYTRELFVLQERWGTKTYQDPVHSPNLDRASERFIVGL